MTFPHKIQMVVGILVILTLSVFVLINREVTEVDFLFGTFVVSRALLFLSFFFSGALVGWVAHSILKRRGRSRREKFDRETDA